MKNIVFILMAMFAVSGFTGCKGKSRAIDAAHNSRNSLNWDGVYQGTLPAASAPGMNVTITLNTDETYKATYEYIDREGVFTNEGTFNWDDTGGIIILDVDPEKEPSRYMVGENTLTQLDLQGNMITGSMADLYVLHKIP
jgi:uncharacterized lipoprotein NlpE involved in copper resistance